MSIQLTKINSFSAAALNGGINVSAGLKIALTNTAHTASWSHLSDLTEISYTNLSARVPTFTSCNQVAGLATLILAQLLLTTSGSVGPFRYLYLYETSSGNNNLIGYYDYGYSITLYYSGDQFNIAFDTTNGVLTLQ